MIPLLQTATDATVSWTALANVGSGALICGVWAYCFSAMGKQRKETAEESATQRKEFTASLAGITTQFGDRVQAISAQVSDSNERVELAMRDLASELRTGVQRPRVTT